MLLGLMVLGVLADPTSQLVYPGPDGRLIYQPDERGNTICDFSHAGYRGGGVALPELPVRLELEPGDGDQTARIQAALDDLAARELDAAGWRGALLLRRGTWPIAGSLSLAADGMVLRGEGQDEDGTVLLATGTEPRVLIRVGGTGDYREVPDSSQPITDPYVATGSRRVTVADAQGFAVGQTVIVHRTSTAAWIAALGMDRIPPRSDGEKVIQWKPGSYDLRYPRQVVAIEGATLVLDAPLSHQIDQADAAGRVYRVTTDGLVRESGVESLRAVSEYKGPTDEAHARSLVGLDRAENCWARNLTALHFIQGCAATGDRTRWITIQDCAGLDMISQIRGGRRYPFSLHGHLNLGQRLQAREGRHDFATGTTRSNGIVFLDCLSHRIHASTEPHHRYSTGILYDNVDHLEPATTLVLGLWNRLNYGSGHGWAAAWSVLWNCVSPAGGVTCERPPLAQNYAIGVVSAKMSSNMRWGEPRGLTSEFRPGEAWWEHWNPAAPVRPRSLYLAQLRDRLGPAAITAIAGPDPRGHRWDELAADCLR